MCYKEIKQNLQKSKENNTLFIHVIAGHTQSEDGMQTLLLNEYEASETMRNGLEHKDFNHYYKKFHAELEIRDIANRYPNSYHFVLFISNTVTIEPGPNFYCR